MNIDNQLVYWVLLYIYIYTLYKQLLKYIMLIMYVDTWRGTRLCSINLIGKYIINGSTIKLRVGYSVLSRYLYLSYYIVFITLSCDLQLINLFFFTFALFICFNSYPSMTSFTTINMGTICEGSPFYMAKQYMQALNFRLYYNCIELVRLIRINNEKKSKIDCPKYLYTAN